MKTLLVAILSVTIGLTSSYLQAKCHMPKKLPYLNGWLGGDVGASLKLPDGRFFWIFGDSFIGNKQNQKTRIDSNFINNSIALSYCDNNDFKIHYFWDKKEKTPASFFKNSREAEFYWPMSSFFVGDHLFINLLRLKYDEGGSFVFTEEGVDLVRISNWKDSPQEWEKIYIPVSDTKEVFPSAEAVVKDEAIYLYAHRRGTFGLQQNVLAKVKIEDALTARDLREKILYRDVEGHYSRYSSERTQAIIFDGNTEITVKKIKDSWVMVQMKRNRAFGIEVPDQVTNAHAPDLHGPWSSNHVIYEVPETKADHPSYNQYNFCYAAKLHENLEISYVCNTTDPLLIWERMDIYTPKILNKQIFSKAPKFN